MAEELSVKGKTLKEVGESLSHGAHRVALILLWARDQRDTLKELKSWPATLETMEGVVFNLERADALLRNEARVIERAAALEEEAKDA